MLMRALGPAQNMNIQVVYAIDREHIIMHHLLVLFFGAAPVWFAPGSVTASCMQSGLARRHSS